MDDFSTGRNGAIVGRIFLDNAATSWPKPESVYQAVDRFQRDIGSSAGRGAYKDVKDAGRLVSQTRQLIARFINADGNRNNIAFTYSGTDALCTAIQGIVLPGDHVVTSVAEHNSVLRPLDFLESQRNVKVSRVVCDADGRIDASDVIAEIRPNTKLVVLSHVSNLTGAIQPIERVGAHCRTHGAWFLVDAAQSIGHLPIDVKSIGCDMLAAPGHKGIMAPLGTGFFYYSRAIANRLRPLRFGGTGTAGGVDKQPTETPDKFESGSLNVPGIVGMNAGLKFLATNEGKERVEKIHEFSARMLQGLQLIDGVTLHGPRDASKRVGVFSISFDNVDNIEAAKRLDAKWSIQTRAGLHCAPLLHRALGTETTGGLVRMSIGLFNTRKHIDIALGAVDTIANRVSRSSIYHVTF